MGIGDHRIHLLKRPKTIIVTTSWKPHEGDRIMEHIVVDDQQAKVISEAKESVEIRDARGGHLGYVAHQFTDDDIAIAKQRLVSHEPRYTTQQVLDHLRSLVCQAPMTERLLQPSRS
jgi:hypothetical protein